MNFKRKRNEPEKICFVIESLMPKNKIFKKIGFGLGLNCNLQEKILNGF